MAQSLARIYDMQHAPETRDVMTFEQENGLRASYSYYLPTKPEDLLLRRRNTAVWVREVFGIVRKASGFLRVDGRRLLRHPRAACRARSRACEEHRDLFELRARPRSLPLALD